MSEEYGFEHTSSPNFPQANGEVKEAVKTVKTLLNKNDDPLIAPLIHYSTPSENGYSPAELLMGCKLRKTVLVIPKSLLFPDHIKFKLKVNNIVIIINTSFCFLFSQTLHQLIPPIPTQSYMAIVMSPVTTAYLQVHSRSKWSCV